TTAHARRRLDPSPPTPCRFLPPASSAVRIMTWTGPPSPRRPFHCVHSFSGEVPMPLGSYTNLALAEQLLAAIDTLSGLHPGFRPLHAKGVMCSGTFAPSAEAAGLTRAPHANHPSTPVTLRYSNAQGVPTGPDNDP